MGFSSGDAREIKRWMIFGGWLAINGLVFGLYHRLYNKDSRYRYFKELAGDSFPVTRAAGACINLNMAVILLPVCRNLIGFLRTISPVWLKQVYDGDIRAHKTIAYMIVFWSVIHCLGHYWNLLNVTNSWLIAEGLVHKLNDFGGLNPVPVPYSNITKDIFEIQAGYTGILLALIFYIMLTTAAVPIRRSFFELFYYVHHIFIFIYPILFFHGNGAMIKRQINTDEHDPDYCGQDAKLESWGDAGDLCPAPQYEGLGSTSWMWFIPSVGVYAIETIIRVLHIFFPVTYVSHKLHQSNVLEIRFSRDQCTISGNKHKIGQFVFIKIPEASILQWHPFTLTSAPEDGFMMVHIRVAGNWTRKVHQLFKSGEIPKIIIDGPYGSPSQGLYDHDTVLCCGTGIGITPFASFLRSLLHQVRSNQIDIEKKKIYFVWIASQIECFEWFDDLLNEVENEVYIIEPQIYLTMSHMESDAAQDLVVKERQSVMSLGQDPVTRLTKHRTKYGRPDWNEIFTAISNENRNKHVSVFACGPKPFTKQLAETADKYSETTNPWVQYHFYKENF